MEGEHWSVDVIVQGAFEEEETFDDPDDRDAFIRRVAEETQKDMALTQVYVTWHPHPAGEPCYCAQFETDHHPDYTFPEDEPPASP